MEERKPLRIRMVSAFVSNMGISTVVSGGTRHQLREILRRRSPGGSLLQKEGVLDETGTFPVLTGEADQGAPDDDAVGSDEAP
jgi:hypothetical protein